MKKILLISNLPVIYRMDIYKNIIKNYDCHFLFFPDKSSSHKKLLTQIDKKIKTKILNITPLGIFGVPINLIPVINRFDLVINVGFNYVSIWLVLLKLFSSFKLVNWWGGTILSESKISIIKKYFRKMIWQFYDGAICYSDLSLNYLKTLGLNNKKFSVIGNNTYKIPVFTKSHEKKFDFISVAFQNDRKNTIIILKAFKKLKELISENINMLIIGDGPELQNLKKFSKQNKLNIKFKGNIPPKDVSNYLIKSKVFIHNAKIDQWPQAYNESQIFRIPSLVSSSSGISDYYYKKNKTIISYRFDDMCGLSKKMREILQNKDLYNSLLIDIDENLNRYNSETSIKKIKNLIFELTK